MEKESLKKIYFITETPGYHTDGSRTVYLNGVCYHVKNISSQRLTNELISNILAQKGNLNTPELEIGITMDNQLSLLSKDFRIPGKRYLSGFALSPQYYGNPNIFNTIQEYEEFLNQIEDRDTEILLLQLLKMSVFDAFRKEQDRNGYNYYFEEDNYNHMILIDHSESFFGKKRYFVQNEQFSFPSKSNTIIPYLQKYKELREMVQLYRDMDMENIFQEFENTYPIFLSNEQKESYKKEVEGPKKVFSNWLNKM